MRIEVGTKLKAKTDLYWSDGKEQHLHFAKGEVVAVRAITLSLLPGSTVPHVFANPDGRDADRRQTIGDDIQKEYEVLDLHGQAL